MAGWWSRNSSKKKHKDDEEEKSGSANFNCMKSSTRKGKKKGKVKDKTNNFDELLPHAQRVFQYGYASSTSTSGSSASSSASFDDHPTSPHFHFPNRGLGTEMKLKVKSKCNVGSRGLTSNLAATSPLHPRLHLFSLDSAQDHGRSQSQCQGQCHPLPLPPPPPSPPPFNTPSLKNITSNLSKWQKGKLLGRGTFGHVYLGFNSESGQMCAIKEVKLVLDDQTSKECLKQLNQEINLLNQLSHPNIVQYYGSELGKEVLSVYLEYVSGGSIHKLLQEYGPFSEPVIQIYTRQIVSGLAYLHARNTVHRDIKGANILVDPNGEIKLADFGMAKHINSSASMLSFKGSPHWMAPEVVMNTNGYSLPVDIWSLGCTVLEMATARPPWSQFEGVAAIFKIGNSEDIPEIPEHLSNDAKNFIKLCLRRNPLARPTAQKLLDHPFIRDQSATKASNFGITRDAFPYMFDGSRTPQPDSKPHLNRTSMTSHDRDLAATSGSNNPRDNTRIITSLPVSPSSSPLRQYGAAQKSCFSSPTHSNYTMTRQSNHPSSFPVRLNATFTLDPRHETSLYRAQTPPGGSPRTRLI